MKLAQPYVCPLLARTVVLTTAALTLFAANLAAAQPFFPLAPPVVSTVPSNGDVNPYGVAFAPRNLPAGPGLQAGDILVSNFNDSNNLQGRGTTVVRVDRNGNASTFFTSSAARSGMSAAIGILSDGVVLVANVPTLDGTPATIGAGSLQVLDRAGNLVGSIGSLASVNGPWGMAVYDTGNGVSGSAHIFLSNVLSGTIARFDVTYTAGNLVASVVTIATGFNHRLDPAAIVLGPSGLAYDAGHDTLYVASSDDNAIYKVSGAMAAMAPVSYTLVAQDPVHLHGPLDLALLPNGHLLVANSDGSNVDPNQPSELVEYSASGAFVSQMPIDPNNGGAFGLAANNLGWGTIRLAAVDDNANALKIWTTVLQ